jgi:hypothetical protein
MEVKMYDFQKFCEDYGIEFKPENSRGYISVACPYCGDGKFHGGFHSVNGWYVCWKCGGHPLYEITRIFSGRNWKEIYLSYKTDMNPRDMFLLTHGEEQKRPEKLTLPEGTRDLNLRSWQYLKGRGYDAGDLKEKFRLQSTDHWGDFAFRIIIPIYFENILVSYTARDYSGQSDIRYMSCKKELEIINHKDILYNYDNIQGNHVIVVEGPADCWRIGKNSVALFGTGFRREQVNLLASFDKVSILFDGEEEARKKGDELGGLLAGMGVDVEAIYLSEGDPGSLKQDEADQLVKEILN